MFLIYGIVHKLWVLELRWILEVYFPQTLSQIQNPIFNIVWMIILFYHRQVNLWMMLCDCYSNINDNSFLGKDNNLLRIILFQSDIQCQGSMLERARRLGLSLCFFFFSLLLEQKPSQNAVSHQDRKLNTTHWTILELFTWLWPWVSSSLRDWWIEERQIGLCLEPLLVKFLLTLTGTQH